ncbi:glycosyltransferase family 2 protein [Flavobacterium sp. DG2-3]|uniref:glycosyltransferase family 2 protein n=1 Tax=Flavobacterium sp. DG2-3 TaxID=3068317 RepID=UPI00273E335C|nr:glycosyltransferase family 2 protein [Flavobacterium sp. DG2-3]MDP5200688.1 glycosyltransferase family 2 protein [Flavobacterium sp. DG2-3]
MQNKIFVIVVTFNGMQWIEDCLNSILNNAVSSHVIVIDNCSTDGTIEFIKLNFKSVLLIQQNKNLGFGAANNIGLNIALEKGGEYFVLLNQDAYLKEDTIGLLIEQMEANPEYGVLSPVHLNGKGNRIDLLFQTYVNANNCKDFYSDLFLRKDLKNIYDVSFVNAAIWLLSKKTLQNVGGFNPYFFHYAEDNDYINRCRFKKLKVGIVPKSVALHDRDVSERTFTLKNFVNANDLKLLNPNNAWTVNKMLKFILKRSIVSILLLNKSDLTYNLNYLVKTLKKYKRVKSLQQESMYNEYSFLSSSQVKR